ERLIRARNDLPALLALVEDRINTTPLEQQTPLIRQAAELCEQLGRGLEAAAHYEELRARARRAVALARARAALRRDGPAAPADRGARGAGGPGREQARARGAASAAGDGVDGAGRAGARHRVA